VSEENVEIVRRGFEHFLATGEIPWDLFDENVEIHDHGGIEVTREDALVYRLRDGKIVRGDYYNDRSLALQAVGLAQ